MKVVSDVSHVTSSTGRGKLCYMDFENFVAKRLILRLVSFK